MVCYHDTINKTVPINSVSKGIEPLVYQGYDTEFHLTYEMKISSEICLTQSKDLCDRKRQRAMHV